MENLTVTRRAFTGTLAFSAATLVIPAQAQNKKIRMYTDLGCGHLGVSADQKKAIEYAAKFGFEGVDVHLSDLMKMSAAERKELVDGIKAKNLRWGTAGLPPEFRKDEDTFQKGMKDFPAQAKVMQEIGVDRVVTWIMPGRDDLTYLENFNQHATRLREAAKVMKDHGIRFGLEFVGPMTLRNRFRYPFIHTQKEMLQLCDEIGTGNCGLLFDSFHWFTSQGTVDEILSLKNEQIILVHVNDARPGRKPEEQIDGERGLPCSTGVIDLKAFMNALQQIGYDGPVTVEPFDQALRDMDDEIALQKTIDSLKQLFAFIEV